MNNKQLYKITRFFLKPLIILVDFLQNNFTKNFALMNIGTTEMQSYKNLIKSFFKKKDFILDCGCGIGHFCKLFNSKRYVGIEINDNFVTLARDKNPNYLFDNFKGKKIDRYKKKINSVLINNVVHHLSPNDVKKVFSYLKEKTKKRKIKILIIEPILPSKYFSIEYFLKVLDIGNYVNDVKGYNQILKKYVKIQDKSITKFKVNEHFKSSTLIIKGIIK